jgi:hypothetical protein
MAHAHPENFLQAIYLPFDAQEIQLKHLESEGGGGGKPCNYAKSIGRVLHGERFDPAHTFYLTFATTLFHVWKPPSGVFIIKAWPPGRAKEQGKINRFALETLGIKVFGDILITAARRCGKNDSLYDFASICPADFCGALCNGQWDRTIAAWFLHREQMEEHTSAVLRNGSLIGQSALLDERSREWWEELVKRRQRAYPGRAKIGTSVWCAACGAKYKKLKLCAGCSSVAYCSSTCLQAHMEKHRAVCGVLQKTNPEETSLRETSLRETSLREMKPPA